ncbi:MAG: ElyC/SanA/YdcF family protein [Thermodesulfobacteriota bacterium]
MFLLKKLLSRMFFPVPLCLEIIGLGLVLLFLRREKAGRFFILSGFVLFFILSMNPVADTALDLLERQYPPLRSAEIPSGLQYIVVLGAGHDSFEEYPANAAASATTVERVIEGLRIKKMAPAARLVFTGGKIKDEQSNARIMADIARQFGIPASEIILEQESLDSKDHVSYLRPLLNGEDFVLVTSASHMPRAAALFRAAGLKPLPSGADFKSLNSAYSPWNFFPSANALEKNTRVFYECLGLIWARFRGQIETF